MPSFQELLALLQGGVGIARLLQRFGSCCCTRSRYYELRKKQTGTRHCANKLWDKSHFLAPNSLQVRLFFTRASPQSSGSVYSYASVPSLFRIRLARGLVRLP